MAFAVEPHIFDWIFFDDSSTSKLGGFNHTKVGNKMSTFGVYPHHRLARCMRYISGVGCLCCLFVLGAAKAWILGKLMQWPALFYGLIRK